MEIQTTLEQAGKDIKFEEKLKTAKKMIVSGAANLGVSTAGLHLLGPFLENEIIPVTSSLITVSQALGVIGLSFGSALVLGDKKIRQMLIEKGKFAEHEAEEIINKIKDFRREIPNIFSRAKKKLQEVI